jgi:hypothetical protein
MQTRTRILLAAGAVLFAGLTTAFAGPVNTRGIPANAVGIVHVDVDSAKKSKVFVATQNAPAATQVLTKFFAEVAKEVGLSVEKDVNDVTIGIFGEGDNGLIVVRGNFKPAQIFAAAQKNKLKLTTIKRYTFIEVDAGNLGGGVAATSKSGKPTKAYISPFGTKTLVLISDLALADAAIAAHRGEAKSFALPASFATFSRQIGPAPIAAAYANLAALPQKPKAPADAQSFSPGFGVDVADLTEAFLAFGDDGKNVKSLATILCKNAEAAQQLHGTLQMGTLMARQFLASETGPDGKPDPKKAANAAAFTKLLNGVAFSAAGSKFNITVSYPTAELVSLIQAGQGNR